MTAIRITQLQRHDTERPYFTAHVHANGSHAEASNRYGSWLTADGRRELRPEIAAQLQRRLPREARSRR